MEGNLYTFDQQQQIVYGTHTVFSLQKVGHLWLYNLKLIYWLRLPKYNLERV